MDGGAIGYVGAVALLAAALVTDVRTMTIPNRLTMPALALGIGAHGITDGWQGVQFAAAGAAAGAAMMLVLYMLRAVGAGDVKVFAALGAWLGAAAAMDLAVYSMLFAGAYGVLAALTWRIGLRRLWAWAGWQTAAGDAASRPGVAGRGIRIPFMLAVCPGAAALWLFG